MTKTIFDLEIGSHASQIPAEDFIDFACGTNGGPPSLPIAGWTDYARCAAEPATGFHEVYFRYDDEEEFIKRAKFGGPDNIDRSTAFQNVPIIASALFDDDGFLVGYRMVTDPRVDVVVRENSWSLSNFLRARFDNGDFVCEDLPPADGESSYQGLLVKRDCRRPADTGGLEYFLAARFLRKPGQTAVSVNGPTTGEFESTAYFQATLVGGVPDPAARLAALTPLPPSPRVATAAHAMNCPGCDLAEADLKRANLTNANLAGAILARADLHGAILAGADLTGADLTGANINRADVHSAKLAGAILTSALLYSTRLDGADLSGADLRGTYAGFAQFRSANLSGAVLMNSDLHNARFNFGNLSGADFTGSLMDWTEFIHSDLTGTIVVGTSLKSANFTNANLANLDASGADFVSANFRDADLSSANLSDSRLTMSSLSLARLAGANLSGAILPAGFEPQ